MRTPVTAQITWSPSESTRKVPGRYCTRAVLPLPVMSIASLLALVEQAGLRWQIGSLDRPLNPRLPSRCAVNGHIDMAVTEAEVELARCACVRGVSQSFAATVGDPDEAAAQRAL